MWSSTHDQVGTEYCFPDLQFRELCIFELSNKKRQIVHHSLLLALFLPFLTLNKTIVELQTDGT